jgi:hypothetical protein
LQSIRTIIPMFVLDEVVAHSQTRAQIVSADIRGQIVNFQSVLDYKRIILQFAVGEDNVGVLTIAIALDRLDRIVKFLFVLGFLLITPKFALVWDSVLKATIVVVLMV